MDAVQATLPCQHDQPPKIFLRGLLATPAAKSGMLCVRAIDLCVNVHVISFRCKAV